MIIAKSGVASIDKWRVSISKEINNVEQEHLNMHASLKIFRGCPIAAPPDALSTISLKRPFDFHMRTEMN